MPSKRKTMTTGIPDEIRLSAEVIMDCTSMKPDWGIVLGSGLSGMADALDDKVFFPYESLYGFSPTTVVGHPGKLVIGKLAGICVAAFQGRSHIYEGAPHDRLVSSVRLSRALGADKMIITNAAGSLSTRFRAGDFMPLTGHLNFMYENAFKTGHSPGHSCSIFDNELNSLFIDTASALGIRAFPGVYAAMTGPVYETPAEARALAALGADAVGMSTLPESVEASLLGMKVLAVSCVTNEASPCEPGSPGPSHDEVLAAGARATSYLVRILRAMIKIDV